ncbi:mechanosensitive ion channel family protein [Sulfurimonas sp. CS5]|uniref:mechanosensitive ion channel family protein n=1 Tax=Sulfurimonas sp. CS5 TaxID=3391145 RepID=UPI0039E8EB7D
MRAIIFILLISQLIFSEEIDLNSSTKSKQSGNIWENKNVWVKTYVNNKNYYTIINNIVKIEQKIKKNKENTKVLASLNRKLEIYKSRLRLYEQNKSFEGLLLTYKFDMPRITAYDYLYKDSLNKLNKQLKKIINTKNDFNKAHSLLRNYYSKNQNGAVSLEDIKYFEEFVENINKTYLNLLETKDELNKKYDDYYQEKLQRHIMTFVTFILVYLLYRLVLLLFTALENKLNKENNGGYKKIISLIFYILVFISLVIRYMEDFIYIITFLSVIAAALTIALREVILNIVASVYIFFSNMIRVGDRVMVQFETKHTIGDILDISLMKIKLNEIEDYSNLKEVKNVGRTIYIPNSYVFTKVFYNYSRKKNGLINDLIEFEFATDNDFENIEKVTQELLSNLNITHKITFALNNLKTGVIGLISYQTNYKQASKIRGDISIKLLQAYNLDENIKLKSSKAPKKSVSEDSE